MSAVPFSATNGQKWQRNSKTLKNSHSKTPSRLTNVRVSPFALTHCIIRWTGRFFGPCITRCNSAFLLRWAKIGWYTPPLYARQCSSVSHRFRSSYPWKLVSIRDRATGLLTSFRNETSADIGFDPALTKPSLAIQLANIRINSWILFCWKWSSNCGRKRWVKLESTLTWAMPKCIPDGWLNKK